MKRLDRKGVTDKNRTAKREDEPDLYAISELHPLPHETDQYQLDLLKSAMGQGPNSRMAVLRAEDNVFQSSLGSNVSSTPAISTVQNEPLRPPEQPLSQQSLQLPQQLPEEPPPLVQRQQQQPQASPQIQSQQLGPFPQQFQPQDQSIALPPQDTTEDDMLQQQQHLSRWNAFLIQCLQMRVGGARTWGWLTNLWVQNGSAPFVSEEEEQREFQHLSQQELLSTQADIVGSSFSSLNEPTYEVQQEFIYLLRLKIVDLPLIEKGELVEACSRNSRFVDDAWSMLFLRAEDFDVECAAKRLAAYWRMRVNFLGREKAFLPFTIKNAFSDEQVQTLKMGFARVLPVTDLYGRSILLMEPGRIHGKVYDTDVMVRSALYVCHALIERPEFQRKGVVVLANHNTADPGRVNTELISKWMNASNCFPSKVRAIHLCTAKKFMAQVTIPISKYFLSPFLRRRILIHKEEGEELMKQLSLYGLPPERLPTELGGSVVLDHEKWVDDRYARGL